MKDFRLSVDFDHWLIVYRFFLIDRSNCVQINLFAELYTDFVGSVELYIHFHDLLITYRFVHLLNYIGSANIYTVFVHLLNYT